MKIWKNILKYLRDNTLFCIVSVFGTFVLFGVMRSDMVITDMAFCVITSCIAGSSYRRYNAEKARFKEYLKFERYLERVRYELLGNKSNLIFKDCVGVEFFDIQKMNGEYYYRVFSGLLEAYNVLGSGNSNDITDAIGGLQSSLIKECDLRQNIHSELGGLRWIILSAIPAMPLVKTWVVANLSDMNLYYETYVGILIKYGIWTFTLLVFMFFERLGKIKSEEYI